MPEKTNTLTPLAMAQECKSHIDVPIQDLVIAYGIPVDEAIKLIGKTEEETDNNIKLFRNNHKKEDKVSEDKVSKIITPEGKEIDATESINDLTQKMVQTFDELFAGIIDEDTAVARAKAANSICSLLKTQIVYDRLKGQVQNIRFLEDGKAIK